MSLDLDSIVSLAGSLKSIPDDRPAWLRRMPSASDETALYYRFFHELVKRHAPLRIVEVGTYVGTSAAHMAYANKGGEVVTIDINPDAKRHADALKLPNLTSIVSDSVKAVDDLRKRAPFDVCYVDGNHTWNQAYGEYFAYRNLVRDGGLIFFDDLALKMETNEMEIFWDMVPDPKRRLDVCHYTGWGVCQKDPKVSVPIWRDAVKEATRRIEAFRKASRK